MKIKSRNFISRRKTALATIGDVKIGANHPIAIQSMCSTKTEDTKATIQQILELEKEGCDLIRVAVPHQKAVDALPDILRKIHIPLIADIHYDPRLASLALEKGAHKIRINPGNMIAPQGKLSVLNAIGIKSLEELIRKAKKHKACIRIGVNSGSLEKDLLEKYGHPTPEALVASAKRWVRFFQDRNFKNLVLSIKSSHVPDMIRAYELAAKMGDVPFHLGVTEAGPTFEGCIKNAVGMGVLLRQGIGDTLRVSLTTHDKCEEVRAAKEILKSLNFYKKEPNIISCPTCGRTEINLLALVDSVKAMIRDEKIKGALNISVLGCTVNALGEAREADFAIAGGRKQGNIYYKGKLYKSGIPEKDLLKEFLTLIRSKTDSQFKV
ncbi:MAG: flavodoxin-dependent (E)-4-hydroxy-3-methylbut-2-enyl-diphosphate synthase [Candidatus Gracilibacteria bacterium]